MGIPNKMSPVAVEMLPEGYTRLAYLESDSNQHINLGFKMTNEHSVTCTYTPLSFVWINAYYGANAGFNFWASYDYNGAFGRRCSASIGTAEGVKPQNSKVDTQLGQTYTSYLSATRFKVDGVVDQPIEGVPEFVTTKNCALFKFHASNGSWGTCGAVRIHAFRAEKNGVAVCEVAPALDPKGRPCMYDLVTHKPFYNLRTGEFIAGLASVENVRNLYLPSTGGILTLGAPAETTEEDINQLKSNNPTWELTVNLRTA